MSLGHGARVTLLRPLLAFLVLPAAFGVWIVLRKYSTHCLPETDIRTVAEAARCLSLEPPVDVEVSLDFHWVLAWLQDSKGAEIFLTLDRSKDPDSENIVLLNCDPGSKRLLPDNEPLSELWLRTGRWLRRKGPEERAVAVLTLDWLRRNMSREDGLRLDRKREKGEWTKEDRIRYQRAEDANWLILFLRFGPATVNARRVEGFAWEGTAAVNGLGPLTNQPQGETGEGKKSDE